jgi:hypothetical protein
MNQQFLCPRCKTMHDLEEVERLSCGDVDCPRCGFHLDPNGHLVFQNTSIAVQHETSCFYGCGRVCVANDDLVLRAEMSDDGHYLEMRVAHRECTMEAIETLSDQYKKEIARLVRSETYRKN